MQVDPLSGWGRLRPLTATDLKLADLAAPAANPRNGWRELLGTMDGERAASPGCTRRRNLHAHHVAPRPHHRVGHLPPDSVEPRLDLHYVVSVMSQQAA